MKTTLLLFLLPILCFAQKPVEITTRRNSDNSVDFLYTKSEPGYYTVEIDFAKLNNSSMQTKRKIIVEYAKGTLFRLTPQNSKKGISYTYRYKTAKGIINPKINQDILYILPVKTKDSLFVKECGNISEKYFGKEKPDTWKAYCFTINSNKVYAMRRGIVVRIENEHPSLNYDEYKYSSKTNKIMVEHEDGTFAVYKGFANNGIKVKLGQQVYPSQYIGDMGLFSESIQKYVFYFLVKYRIEYDGELGTAFVQPSFSINNEEVFLEHKKSYVNLYAKELIFQEFSKREKKKYIKGQLTF